MKEVKQKKIYCVIPAFNESLSIATVVADVCKYVDKVIVVDDYSDDNTVNLATEAGAIVLRHILNLDQGGALRTGTKYALDHGADIVVHFDADGQFLASQIHRLTDVLIRDEADIVFGSRFIDDSSKVPFLKKYIIMPLARVVNLVFFGIKLSDPQSGFRAMNSKAAFAIKIEQDGKAHCSEIIHKAFLNKLRVKEVPITVIYHNFGQNFFSGAKIIKDFFIHKLIK